MEKSSRLPRSFQRCVFSLSLTLFIAVHGTVDAYSHSIHVSDDFHFGLVHSDFDTRLAFFNSQFGPYNGGIIADSPKETRAHSSVQMYFDAPGIYYRYFEFAIVHPGEVIWTLKISLWYPMVALSLPAGDSAGQQRPTAGQSARCQKFKLTHFQPPVCGHPVLLIASGR